MLGRFKCFYRCEPTALNAEPLEAIDAQLGVNHEQQVRAGEEAAEEVERKAPKKRLRKPVPSSQEDYEAARRVGCRRVGSLAESETPSAHRPDRQCQATTKSGRRPAAAAGHKVGGVRAPRQDHGRDQKVAGCSGV